MDFTKVKGPAQTAKAISITGNLAGKEESKSAISTAGKSVGRNSQCGRLTELIAARVEVGLSAQRIYQDLVEENVFRDSLSLSPAQAIDSNQIVSKSTAKQRVK